MARTGPLRVLVVEDNADVAEALIAALQAEGFAVTHFSHAQPLFDLFVNPRCQRFDVALLDLSIPFVRDGTPQRVTGELLAKRLVEAHVPVILHTGDPDTESLKFVIAGGAVLTKPARIEEITAALRKAAGGS